MVDVATLRVTLVTTGGYYSGLSVTSRGLVTARNTQLSPNEIFTVESGVVTQRTFINTEKLKVYFRKLCLFAHPDFSLAACSLGGKNNRTSSPASLRSSGSLVP